jgi:aldehyde dehydrogenase (NAD+)
MNMTDISTVYQEQRGYFETGATRSIDFRKEQLRKLKAAVLEQEAEITAALYQDLRKSEYEAFGSETGQVLKEIDFTIKHLDQWAKPQSVSTPLMFLPSSSRIYRDPLGTVLVIAPWNYPVLLTLSPLISAIAGGNTAVVKPSEEAQQTALVIEKIIQSVYPSSYVHVVQGIGGEVIPAMMDAVRFDHVFFTGSTFVGQKIMEMAAKKLVPVTLELGGKSPCIVDPSANLEYTAKKIVWSKLMNAGQTCVAPDYVLVHHSVKQLLLEKMVENIGKMLGEDPQKSVDFGRIINNKRFSKLVSYLEKGKIVSGGRHDDKDLYIEPTIMEGVDIADPVMQEEIFGPILPIITYNDRQEVVDWVEKNPFPLSLYVYADDAEVQEYYISRIRFGGCCINNGIIHLGNPHLPFGGVGYSGVGQYHGKFGFDAFTRPKSVLHSRSWFDVPVWYAPYKGKTSLLKKIFKYT